ncbi:SIR2 family NAD-dependent protein deacylase [Bacillus inaquosorum]|uniref:SIR2 family NAD-dependent protein deacylase n=1 Tax=Bacillus inaquosorum TaxID=483913 RepID=UPI002280E4DA|nr:SIR2 family protein [Bacillus inaquosorum]MCY7962700.1 SIR2 family protein [Bacillus inaquosorum]
MSKDINDFFKKNLEMYPHLENIRNNLWLNEGKSRVSVMIGAGFSKNGEKIEDSFTGMAIWTDLKERLIEKLPHYSDLEEKDVLDIGQIFVNEYGRSSLDQVLKDAIPDANYEPGMLHHELLKLPWADVFTTNYDTLLERAKMNVFNRNYQVIYDVSDIPSSIQPRIIKLHGSFPANRPFIFTKKDYDDYPKIFSPFVNMVQQSIMETTFLLIGFSGNDPNFRSWTSWVQSNLGEHKPKIYMINLDENTRKRKQELEELGITLIDFTDLYHGYDDPFHSMFSDLFEFLSYKQREEKSLWPHRSYNKFNYENWKYNRLTYPGWVVLPDDKRLKFRIDQIRASSISFINQISIENSIDCSILEKINEIIWCYEKFYIPLNYDQFKKLRDVLEKLISADSYSEQVLPLLFLVLKTARLECDFENFTRYAEIIENLDIKKSNYIHTLVYEKIQLNLDLKDIKKVRNMLENWYVSSKEIEWGIKKAIIMLRLDDEKTAKKMFEEYIKVIRGLLAIKMDDYRLLSLESVALYYRNQLVPKAHSDDSYERLRFLQRTNCDVSKEFNRISVSIRKYELKGYQIKKGFDPHTIKSTTTYEDPIKQELLDSYALIQVGESFGFFYKNKRLITAIDNLKDFYPLYSQQKRIDNSKLNQIDDFLNRENVYKLTEKNLYMLLTVLKNTISNMNEPIIQLNKYLDILSRIYFALSKNQTQVVDELIISYIKQIKQFDLETSKVLNKLIQRMFLAKDLKAGTMFCEKLLSYPIISQRSSDKSYYFAAFFEPFLSLINHTNRSLKINISVNQLENLFNYLSNEDESLKESALIRLTFLELTKCLPQQYTKNFREILKGWRKELKGTETISKFIFSSIFERIIYSDEFPNSDVLSKFLTREIPKFYHLDGTFSDKGGIQNYLQELKNVFMNFVELNEEDVNNVSYYKMWLRKFYLWWDSQKDGLFQTPFDSILGSKESLLKSIIVVLKNNILGGFPLKTFDQEDREKIKKIYTEINENNKTLSFMLLPCMKRLNINVDISLNEVIFYLQGNNQKKINVLSNMLYDFLIFINKNQIIEDSLPIKRELLSLLRYGSMKSVYESINSLGYILKNAPSILDDSDCEFIVSLANKYLIEIKNNEIELSTYEDFEMISAYACCVAYLISNKGYFVKNKLNEWKSFIENHKLPEVRVYADLFV